MCINRFYRILAIFQCDRNRARNTLTKFFSFCCATISRINMVNWYNLSMATFSAYALTNQHILYIYEREHVCGCEVASAIEIILL